MRKIVLLCCILPFLGLAQSGKNKPKNSSGRGTMYGYWGYNRSWHTKSAINFVGPGYDFTLKGSRATDSQTPFNFNTYFNPKTILVPQFNAQIGYYIRNHYALSIGYDNFNYVFEDKNEVLLSGNINPGVDTETNWSGTYNNEPIITDRNTFHYKNRLNFLRLYLERTDQLFKTGNKDLFVISSQVGIGLGSLFSTNDFQFADQKDEDTKSMSGFTVSAHVGLRFEFFRQFFIQTKFHAGYIQQVQVHTRSLEQNAYAKQKFGYTSLDTGIGFFLYIRPTNDCSSCPNW